MDILKQRFQEKAAALFQENRAMLKEHGDLIIDQVAVRQMFGGMRGMKSMIWETFFDQFEYLLYQEKWGCTLIIL